MVSRSCFCFYLVGRIWFVRGLESEEKKEARESKAFSSYCEIVSPSGGARGYFSLSVKCCSGGKEAAAAACLQE